MTLQALEIEEPEMDSSEFSFAIARIAVAQICRSVGFKAAQRSALDTLTDVAARYLQALAKSATASAASTSRTHSNLLDIAFALEDLHSVQGFRGASNVSHTLYTSSALVDLMRFVNYSDEIPFAKPMPRPISSKQPIFPESLGENFRCADGGLRLNHIPRWLPAMPEMVGGGKDGRREEKWGFGSCGDDGEGCLVGEKMMVEREGKMELPAKRRRVRFKMGVGEVGIDGFGVDLKSGACRGGKRVLCQNWIGGEDKSRKKICFKRPR